MAQSPDGPAGTPPRKDQVALFIVGIVAGLLVGGTLLTFLWLVAVANLGTLLVPHSSNAMAGPLPYLGDVLALAIGWWAVVRTSKAMNFSSGALMGLAAGMLGGVSLCAFMFGGTN